MSNPQSLYSKSEKIFPREVDGTFQRLRNYSAAALLGLYYFLPFIQWNDRQAVLFDLPARKFHIFSLTFWPQDFFFLSIILIMAAVLLFFVTSVAGRVWCGFACPQTVWTEAFLWMERLVEGSRAKQIKLAEAPWSWNKLKKVVAKQFLWITFSIFTGLVFVGYFVPIRELIPDFFMLETSGWSLFWVLFYGFATYGNAGYMREQVCLYMCPYARFQSAMFDKDTLIVAYDEKRGEPRTRGARRKETAETNTGDCVDCGLCVQVCPTGIDIREGLQYECIACAACIDVCDTVMEKVGLPTQLIRYSTESQDQGNNKTLMQTVLRPRVFIYAFLLLSIFLAWLFALTQRANFQVDILRDRNAMYRISESGNIENLYQIKLMNKGQSAQQYRVTIKDLEKATVKWSVVEQEALSRTVKAGEIGDFTVVVTSPATQKVRRAQTIQLQFSEALGDSPESITEESRFWGPAN